MKIFISWSGDYSKAVAIALQNWFKMVLPAVDSFVSSEDIRKGKRWPIEVAKELDQCNVGLVCLTADNLTAQWLMFESGALAKSLKDSSLYTLLIGNLIPVD